MPGRSRGRPAPGRTDAAAGRAPGRLDGTPRRAGSGGPRIPPRVAWLAVALAAVAVYANSVSDTFVFDDRLLIENNRVVRGEGDVRDVLLAPYYTGAGRSGTGLYRPLTLATFAAEYRLWGLDPRGYHVTNILLHALVSVLVLALARRAGLPPPAAVAGAVLFAVHPIHTEAVANLAGRAELLSAAFFLVALLAWQRARSRGPRSLSRGFAVAAVAFLLALLSKENAVTFLGVAVAWDALLARDRGSGERWRPRITVKALAAPGAALVVYLALRWIALGGEMAGPGTVSPIDNPLVDAGLATRWATAAAVAVRYLALLVVPWRLSPDYSWAQIVPLAPLSPEALGSLAALVAVAAGLAWAGLRSRAVAFLAVFAAISFSIVSNGIVVIGTIMAERLMYLPSAGLCLVLGCALPALARRTGGRPATAVAAVVVVLLSARTVVRNRDWRNPYTLFRAAARTSPRSVKVLGNLGAELLKRGRPAEAREILERALSIAPDYHGARTNLAQCLMEQGDLAGAERELARVLDAEPDHALARFQLGELHLRAGRTAEAEAAFRRVLEVEPGSADARERIATLLAGRGDVAEAEQLLLEARRIDPDSVTVANALGLLRQATGRPEEAVGFFRDAVRRAPESVPLLNNLGNALRDAGRLDESVAELRRAVARDPGFAPSRFNLGLTLERAGRPDEAAVEYAAAVAADPAHGGAQRALGRLALARQDPAAALAPLDRAIALDPADREARALRGRARLALGHWDAAESDYLRLLELNPGSVEARNNLGIVHAMRGDVEGARRWWQEALELAPDSSEIRENLRKLGPGSP